MPSNAPPSQGVSAVTRPTLPPAGERLRLPLHARSQARLTRRWGFDLNAPDADARAEALLADAPADPDRLLLAAAVRSSRGDDAAALDAARRAVDGDGGSARAHTTLATLLARSGDPQRAQRHAARAAALDPEDPASVYNRGVIAWTLGDHAAARADFAHAAQLLGLPRVRWWQRWRRSG